MTVRKIRSLIPSNLLQEVPHVHFHVIPKPDEVEGLGVGWPAKTTPKTDLEKVFEEISAKLNAPQS